MTDTAPRIRELDLYRRYFDLVADERKTIEVRVRYPHLEDLAAGDVILFRVKGTDEACEVRVLRVTPYDGFEALLDGEGPGNINPAAGRGEQLANIREIYPPEKEKLGALAIEMELRDPATAPGD
ncbi:ASCH domain-containing protein [Streptomyces iconiensis]|uniref:ASCH domain-containing protein n=1 Tax=Streptomyces iconiensis TaxID=1384038 RepID=A0ABT6ZXZ4_9ACTN|nr:ASCH domain-containing protein [Streptomyces iconiensis]MDJ1133934.1 ASCH domain-containing protein [Streptomyces iconiensis]